jgi:glucosamine--fructose-6-phosphate aminotransferase (isomerizing)
MLKEIFEQPKAVAETLVGRLSENGKLVLEEMTLSIGEIANIEKIVFVACGTAFHSGMIGKYAMERWSRIPCEVELASEFRYRDPILNQRTLVVAISQSGETMDTLMAIRHAKSQGARVLAICNTQGATIPRESDAVLYTRGGPEIAVASTKAFLTQVVAVELLSLYFAELRLDKPTTEIKQVMNELANISHQIDVVLDTTDAVKELAKKYMNAQSVLFIGRHVGFPVALEGALKLKELAYMHAEGFAAGELKHGPIALIEDGIPVVVIVPSVRLEKELHEKVVSNIQEVRARGARTILIVEEGDDSIIEFADHIIRIPQTSSLLQPLVATVPLQVFSCALATLKGHDVDQPRNLAKSVTVE